MTNQVIVREKSASDPRKTANTVKSSRKPRGEDTKLKKIKESYQAVQQVKYLHLEAEIDVLLQQLQSLNNQRLKKEVALKK